MKSSRWQYVYRMKNAPSIAQFLAAKASTNRLLCPALISRIVRGRLDLSGMEGQFLLRQPLRHSILDACFRNNDCERISAKDESVAGQGQPHMPFTSVLPLAFLVHERGCHESSDSRIPERAPSGTAHGRRALHPLGRSAGNLWQVTQQRLCEHQGRHFPCPRQAAGTLLRLAQKRSDTVDASVYRGEQASNHSIHGNRKFINQQAHRHPRIWSKMTPRIYRDTCG